MAMTSAVITLIGIERSLSYENRSVFDDIVLPSGIDKDILVNTIKLQAGSFEMLYSDPIFLTASINIWSKGWLETWKKWVEALAAEYDPIENYNRYEDLKEEHTGSDSRSGSTQSSDRRSGNNSTSGNGSESSSSTSTDQVSAFNSSSFQDKDKNTTSGSSNSNSSAQGNYSDSSSGNSSNTEHGTDQHLTKHTNHIHGNIGVLTNQSMVESEIRLREEYNIYRLISDLFIKEFCIMTY